MSNTAQILKHIDRARRHVKIMWSRRGDTDSDAIPGVIAGKEFGAAVAVDHGDLAVAETELMQAFRLLDRQDGFELTRWVAGPPTEPGDYHLILEDQGGHPFHVVAHVMKRWREGADPKAPAIAALKGEMPKEEADVAIKAMMRLDILIPALSESLPKWTPLSSLWNCNAHRLIPEPKEL